jgi:hypothetical protein
MNAIALRLKWSKYFLKTYAHKLTEAKNIVAISPDLSDRYLDDGLEY